MATKGEMVKIRMNSEEKALFSEKAQAAGLTLSEWIRAQCHKNVATTHPVATAQHSVVATAPGPQLTSAADARERQVF